MITLIGMGSGTPESLTAQYLTGQREISVPRKRRKGNGGFITLSGVKTNNLKDVDLKIPLGTMTCVTGVSGGGKSSLILETLFKAVNKELNGSREPAGIYDKLTGLENIDKVIDIDQSPIGRTPRSNPATYTGLFTYIRDWFAGLPEAKARGYNAGRFSCLYSIIAPLFYFLSCYFVLSAPLFCIFSSFFSF